MEDPALVAQVETAIREEVAIVGELNKVASKHPYYKYHPQIHRTRVHQDRYN